VALPDRHGVVPELCSKVIFAGILLVQRAVEGPLDELQGKPNLYVAPCQNFQPLPYSKFNITVPGIISRQLKIIAGVTWLIVHPLCVATDL
jgi:hypothetical protein